MKRIADAAGKLNRGKRAYAVLVLCATTAVALPAQTFTTLRRFDKTDGAIPDAALVQATNGDLYGTTYGGGANGGGTVFKITPSGGLTTLYSFLCSQTNCTDGLDPTAGLIQGTDGNFYGTTPIGGANKGGTVFKITPRGTLTTLYGFCSTPYGLCTDGEYPGAGLVQATNGDLYGTTFEGGANNGGTVFKITPGGTLTTLYNFCAQSGCTDGVQPDAGLVLAANGDFYGTTWAGGANSSASVAGGTVFKITPSGTLTTLYSFCSESGCTDGALLLAGLVHATNGDFYGTTYEGGVNGLGTIFKITPSGTLTTLYSFCSRSACSDGEYPYVGLVQATNGDFYGTTPSGGANCLYPCGGTLFKITPGGTLTTLYSFCSQSGCTDGESPVAGLVQATDGDFYGTTAGGGAGHCSEGSDPGCGTVFSLSVGLGPFVKTTPAFGKVGAVVKILGTNLTGATSVSFNGTAAGFTVVSPSLIATTVPVGATNGTIQVTTPGGTLASNLAFRVLP